MFSGCTLPLLISEALEVRMNNVTIDEDDEIPIGAYLTYRCEEDDASRSRSMVVSKHTCAHEEKQTELNVWPFLDRQSSGYCGKHVLKY